MTAWRFHLVISPAKCCVSADFATNLSKRRLTRVSYCNVMVLSVREATRTFAAARWLSRIPSALTSWTKGQYDSNAKASTVVAFIIRNCSGAVCPVGSALEPFVGPQVAVVIWSRTLRC